MTNQGLFFLPTQIEEHALLPTPPTDVNVDEGVRDEGVQRPAQKNNALHAKFAWSMCCYSRDLSAKLLRRNFC